MILKKTHHKSTTPDLPWHGRLGGAPFFRDAQVHAFRIRTVDLMIYNLQGTMVNWPCHCIMESSYRIIGTLSGVRQQIDVKSKGMKFFSYKMTRNDLSKDDFSKVFLRFAKP